MPASCRSHGHRGRGATSGHAWPQSPPSRTPSPGRGHCRGYERAMTEAASTMDLTEVLNVLATYRELAEIAQRQGPQAHFRMLEAVERLQRGQDVPVVAGHLHKAEISARLGR